MESFIILFYPCLGLILKKIIRSWYSVNTYQMQNCLSLHAKPGQGGTLAHFWNFKLIELHN